MTALMQAHKVTRLRTGRTCERCGYWAQAVECQREAETGAACSAPVFTPPAPTWAAPELHTRVFSAFELPTFAPKAKRARKAKVERPAVTDGRPAVVSVRVNDSDTEVVRLEGRWLTEPVGRPGSAANERAALLWRQEHGQKDAPGAKRAKSVRYGASTYAVGQAPAECAASCMCRVPGWVPDPCRPAVVAPIERSDAWKRWYSELQHTRVTLKNECSIYLVAGAGPAFEKLAKKRAGKTKG